MRHCTCFLILKVIIKRYKLKLTFASLLDQNENDHLHHEFCSLRVDDETRGGISVTKENQISMERLIKSNII